MNYKIGVKAAEDIEGIWLYTFENWSLEQADKYIELIFDKIEYIASHPDSGKDYSHIRKHYRCSKIESHLIFYRTVQPQNEVEIIRILHRRMDIENRLQE